MELFIHTSKGVEIAEVTDSMTAEDLLAQLDLQGATVWKEDTSDPIDPGSVLGDVIDQRGHVHISTCQRIDVRVRYAGETKNRDFPPSATIQAVFRWAVGPQGFNLPTEQRAIHDLGVCDTFVLAERTTQIGSLTEDCQVCIDLAPRDRFQG